MSRILAGMDDGLQAAVRAAGGIRPLARLLGINVAAVARWTSCPKARLFDVAEKTKVDATVIRPDLEDWIFSERSRRRLAAARAQHSIVRAAVGPIPREADRSLEEGMLDIMIALAAARFVAEERAVAFAAILTGQRRKEAGGRAWAMALALVVGRARATTIGVMFGTSRQNVDNASERYLRARDGDDPGDFLEGDWGDGKARVLERGRIRRAKVAQMDFWAAEDRFRARIFPEGEPERRRA